MARGRLLAAAAGDEQDDDRTTLARRGGQTRRGSVDDARRRDARPADGAALVRRIPRAEKPAGQFFVEYELGDALQAARDERELL